MAHGDSSQRKASALCCACKIEKRQSRRRRRRRRMAHIPEASQGKTRRSPREICSHSDGDDVAGYDASEREEEEEERASLGRRGALPRKAAAAAQSHFRPHTQENFRSSLARGHGWTDGALPPFAPQQLFKGSLSPLFSPVAISREVVIVTSDISIGRSTPLS